MTDRELLELAAKAVELPECGWMGPAFMYVKDNTFTDWNPLTDDGDALRLAVKLEINISLYAEKGGRVYAQTKHLLGFGTDGEPSYQAHNFMKEEYGSDPLAATRRAITRAAIAKAGRTTK